MSKKVGIVTLAGNFNYGNRLQNVRWLELRLMGVWSNDASSF